jgi:HlyD family secretion protein
MQVNASVAESDIGRIRTGQPVSFRVDAYPDQAFPGVVTQVRLEPVIQQSVVSYVTTIEVANPDLLLKPGMTATVTVETGRADDAVRIPNAALRVRMPAEIVAQFEAPTPAGQTAERPARSEPSERSERATTGIKTTGEPGRRGEVWVMEDGQLRRVPVRVGVSDGRFTALIDGDLPEGATVVTNVATVTGTSTTTQSPLLPQRGRGAGGAGRGNTAPGR